MSDASLPPKPDTAGALSSVPQPLTRRDCLRSGALALSSVALASGDALSREPTHVAHTHPLIRLALNENPLGPSPRVVQALKDDLHDLCRYTAGEAEAFTAQIARKEGVSPEQIVIGDVLAPLGVQLSLAGGPGGEFLYSTPGFTDLVDAAHQSGGQALGIPLDARLQNDLPAFSARTGSRTRAVYLVNPHNPSGTVTEPATFRSFVRDLARRTLVIVDEAYLEFMPDFAGRTLVDLVRAGSQVIVFRTFDKAYGLAALQMGYAVAPLAIAKSLHSQGIGAPHTLNRLAVTGAAAALDDAAFLATSRRFIAAERARWIQALDQLGLTHSQSMGNFIFFDARRPQQQVAAAFRAEGIDIGRSFPPLTQWVRISIGLREENTRAIAVLRKLFT